jgi:DNA polymerase-3 subunit gamma/tau
VSASSSRRYRPQRFADVLGQDPIVQALKNAIRSGRLAQAYLLSGERGTGKTTLARLIAKALNCSALTTDEEPCSQCSSCLEIANGTSLEVIELDGASHRGIEDIRTITEGISFGIGPTGYKVVIVDEVHMLTKEAFNALLKTLEEPPPRCLFLFATTEPHKVLPTIVSRCQRFHLHRIPRSLVIQKLQRIAKELEIPIEQGALERIADRAEGGMRDGESLLDQVIAFADGKVTEKDVETVFGLPSKASYQRLDAAVQSGDFAFPFTLVEELYQEGKHLIHFFEGLVDHFRAIVRANLQGTDRPPYRHEQAMSLFSDLVRRLDLFRQAHHPRVFLEETLLHIIRSRYVLPVDLLIKRLEALEQLPPQPQQPPSYEPILSEEQERPAPALAPSPTPKQTHTFSPREETLLQFAAVELEGIIKR